MDFTDFLTKRGRDIYQEILDGSKARGIDSYDPFDRMQLAMLANSLDLYARMAVTVNKKGETQKPADGGWDQVRPEYTIMRTEFQNIVKHAGNFGLSREDRIKLMAPKQGKQKMFDLTPVPSREN
jgi:P27 family predicted phage terminase small subunit